MQTVASLFGGSAPNLPDRQAHLVRAILAILGLILSGVGWLRWAL